MGRKGFCVGLGPFEILSSTPESKLIGQRAAWHSSKPSTVFARAHPKAVGGASLQGFLDHTHVVLFLALLDLGPPLRREPVVEVRDSWPEGARGPGSTQH